MRRWDALLLLSGGLGFAAILSIGWLLTTYGQPAVIQMPLGWMLVGLLLLFMAGALLGYYRGTWQQISGGRGGGGTFMFWILMVLAGGAILRGLLSFLGS